MRPNATLAFCTCVALASASLAVAGQGQGRERRAPNQAPQTGQRDDATVEVGGQIVQIDPVSGQVRQPSAEDAAALARQFDKRTGVVSVVSLPGGGRAAQLDDSFMEALTVTKAADGTLRFSHAPAGATQTTTASARAPRTSAVKKAAVKKAPVALAPLASPSTLEEK